MFSNLPPALHFVIEWEKKWNKLMLIPNMFTCLSTDTTSFGKWSDCDVKSLWSMAEAFIFCSRRNIFYQCLILQLLKNYTMLFFSSYKCIKIDILPERTLNSIHFKYSSDPLLNNFHSVGLSSLFALCFPDILSVLSQNHRIAWVGRDL